MSNMTKLEATLTLNIKIEEEYGDTQFNINDYIQSLDNLNLHDFGVPYVKISEFCAEDASGGVYQIPFSYDSNKKPKDVAEEIEDQLVKWAYNSNFCHTYIDSEIDKCDEENGKDFEITICAVFAYNDSFGYDDYDYEDSWGGSSW